MRRHDRRDRDERGAVTLFVGLFMAVLLGVAAIVVDIGTQRVARADMQALADVVALDLARELNGRSASEIGSLQTLANTSRDRNTSTVGETPEVTPTLWVVDPTTGAATAASGGDVPNAVKVEASTSVDFAFGLADAGSASRSATAMANPNACLRLGTSELELNTADSVLLDGVLGQVLGGTVALTALDYERLARTTVTLGDLAAQLGAGAMDTLLTSSVSVETFYAAVVSVLREDGETAAADLVDAQLLDAVTLAGALDPVVVGDLLSIGPGDNAAAAATVDVFSLVTGAAYVADRGHALNVPGLTLATPTNSSSVGVKVTIVEAPRLACNRGTASTSQLRVALDLDIESQLRILGVPLLGGSLAVELLGANATGGISSVRCADGASDGLDVRLDELTAAELAADLDLDVLGLPIADLTIPGTEPSAGSVGLFGVDLPEHFDAPYSTPAGSGSLGLSIGNAELSAAGVPPIRLGAVVGILDPLLEAVENLLLDVVAPALGLRIANADVYGVRTPACLNPSLVD